MAGKDGIEEKMKENRKAGLEGESNGGTEGGMVSGRDGEKRMWGWLLERLI